jgi:DNA-binding LacI/PurR family transcriptional regulator
MKRLRRQSLIEITADHLREGFRTGRWRGLLPGVLALASELDVSKDTVRAALRLLESEGSLQDNGAGRSRKIMTRRIQKKRTLRIAILTSLPFLEDNSRTQRLLLVIKNALETEGHVCLICDQVSYLLPNCVRRMTRLVAATEADAWIVYEGTQEVLGWFVKTTVPALALGGRMQDLPMASSRTDFAVATEECVDALVALGHARIVLLAPEAWRHPTPSLAATAFLERLKHHGLPATVYNLPDWEPTAEGFESLMKALFFATPPTAFIFTEPSYCAGARLMLAEMGLRVPADVSLVNLVPDAILHLQRPELAYYQWPPYAHLKRILRWVKAVQTGQEDKEAYVVYSKFVPGGTIGSAKKR